MVKIIVFIVMSFDGYIADEHGDVDWLLSGNQTDDYGYESFYKTINALIMGSKTYERFLIYGDWPYSDKKTYVFTQRPLLTSHDNIEFISDDVNTFITNIRNENISNELIMNEPLTQRLWLVGGSKLIASFYNQGLIDEYFITIIPKEIKKGIVLSKAIRDGIGMKEIETKYFYDGVVQKHYVSDYNV